MSEQDIIEIIKDNLTLNISTEDLGDEKRVTITMGFAGLTLEDWFYVPKTHIYD